MIAGRSDVDMKARSIMPAGEPVVWSPALRRLSRAISTIDSPAKGLAASLGWAPVMRVKIASPIVRARHAGSVASCPLTCAVATLIPSVAAERACIAIKSSAARLFGARALVDLRIAPGDGQSRRAWRCCGFRR